MAELLASMTVQMMAMSTAAMMVAQKVSWMDMLKEHYWGAL